jgi:hypothetical protein
MVISLEACGSLSPERSSHAKIITTSGKSLYVNRLARGVSYDVMWITEASGECRTPSWKEDILVGEGGSPLYYKLSPDGSFCLFTTGLLDIQKNYPISIKQEIISPIDWPQVKKSFDAGEIQRLVLDLPKSDPCLIRWTEIGNLFGR